MNKDDILNAFAHLSEEDQEAVRKEITGTRTPGEDDAPCCPPIFQEHMKQMTEAMKGGANPMAICEEMMKKCRA